MSRSIDPTVWERWRDRHRRFESSDLTVAAYCQAEGVSPAGFYQWRKKLGDSSAPREAEFHATGLRAGCCDVIHISGCRDSSQRCSRGNSCGRP